MKYRNDESFFGNYHFLKKRIVIKEQLFSLHDVQRMGNVCGRNNLKGGRMGKREVCDLLEECWKLANRKWQIEE